MCTLFILWSQPHVSDRFFSIFGFSLWLSCADTHLKDGIKLWADVLCVRGRDCGSVCLSVYLYCHWGFDLCTRCYWPPLICWSRILTKTNILVWWCWTNKHQPVNISQGRYEGGEDMISPSSFRAASPSLNTHMTRVTFVYSLEFQLSFRVVHHANNITALQYIKS